MVGIDRRRYVTFITVEPTSGRANPLRSVGVTDAERERECARCVDKDARAVSLEINGAGEIAFVRAERPNPAERWLGLQRSIAS